MIPLLALLLATALPGPITGDFDHDGRPDVAAVQREGRDVYVLAVTRGADPGRPVRVGLETSFPGSLSIAPVAEPVATACAKGAGPHDEPCARASVVVTKGDLLLTHAEASEAVMKWDGRRFQLEWLSD